MYIVGSSHPCIYICTPYMYVLMYFPFVYIGWLCIHCQVIKTSSLDTIAPHTPPSISLAGRIATKKSHLQDFHFTATFHFTVDMRNGRWLQCMASWHFCNHMGKTFQVLGEGWVGLDTCCSMQVWLVHRPSSRIGWPTADTSCGMCCFCTLH